MASIIEKYDSFVKDQILHQEKQADRQLARSDEKRSQSYRARAVMLREMWAEITSALSHRASGSPAEIEEVSLRLTPEEIRDLPEELLEQLSISESDRKDFLIVDIINDLGGVTSVDKILVALYRKTGEVEKRTRLVSRLYRMQQKGLIFPSSSRKGVYATTPLNESLTSSSEETELLIDPDSDLLSRIKIKSTLLPPHDEEEL
ncbi:hypothetical protein MXL91_07850 [Achromobacter ruhlandii]|uniref:hypothetical protein n=1 Tax=Achromobacter ruhlandii TaxID=72557 RepID=UPI002DBDD98C|nr:hypothetical protein [Achromobacter ruhlandii]MEB6661349.1 hypothetical protein [Achromobacter ruhlandii]